MKKVSHKAPKVKAIHKDERRSNVPDTHTRRDDRTVRELLRHP